MLLGLREITLPCSIARYCATGSAFPSELKQMGNTSFIKSIPPIITDSLFFSQSSAILRIAYSTSGFKWLAPVSPPTRILLARLKAAAYWLSFLFIS